jgi:hypothetical protein
VTTINAPTIPPAEAFPAEVEMILSAMEAARHAKRDRRYLTRLPYRVRAELKLFSDPAEAEPYTLYTRDVDPRGMGFITNARLPLGYGGCVELFAPDGSRMRIHCSVYRCREAARGWYEGALYFNREQSDFLACP